MSKRKKFSELSELQNTSDFEQHDLQLIIDHFAEEGIVFTNEIQFQLKLAQTIESVTPLKVDFEVVSAAAPSPIFSGDGPFNRSQKNKKIYTDLVIEGKDGEGDIAIELKYKTTGKTAKPKDLKAYHCESLKDVNCVCYRTDRGIVPVFSQGAADYGAYHYLEDVERLERLVGVSGREKLQDRITYGFAGRTISKGYAIIIANDPIYWDGPSREETMSANFYCKKGAKIGGRDICWKAAVAEKDGKPFLEKMKDRKEEKLKSVTPKVFHQLSEDEQTRFIPVKLAHRYSPRWHTYPLKGDVRSFDNEGKEGGLTDSNTVFRYLILEVAKTQ
jgi:hypothetical protein